MNFWNFKRGDYSPQLTKEKAEIIKDLIGKKLEVSFIKRTTKEMGHLCWSTERELEKIENGKMTLNPPWPEPISIEKIYRIRVL